MTKKYFSSASDAGSFMVELLSNDYFQEFSDKDRISDPYGIYAIEAEMTDDARKREALTLFSKASPAERADIFELEAACAEQDRARSRR